MGTTATSAGHGPAHRFGFKQGMVVQELGWDEDIDETLRASFEDVVGGELVDDRYGDVVDAVVLWFRDEDGDLVDGLVDALTDLDDGGFICLLTPKVGSANHVDAADIAEAGPTAGMTTTTSLAAGEWAATKLVAPKAKKN